MSFACGLYDRMLSLSMGEVKPAGIDLNFIPIDNPRELFDRMVGKLEFDASEMSSSEYVSRFAAGKGECPFVALPAFASRVFRHGVIAVDTRKVKRPADLAG
jgi:4,5-dihydroxyphthalate decarboxylase